MPKDSIDHIFVYKANDKGYPGANGATAMPASAACVRGRRNCVAFTWQAASNEFRYAAGSWASTSQRLPDDRRRPRRLHQGHPSLHDEPVRLLDRRGRPVGDEFEPLSAAVCAPGKHL